MIAQPQPFYAYWSIRREHWTILNTLFNITVHQQHATAPLCYMLIVQMCIKILAIFISNVFIIYIRIAPHFFCSS